MRLTDTNVLLQADLLAIDSEITKIAQTDQVSVPNAIDRSLAEVRESVGEYLEHWGFTTSQVVVSAALRDWIQQLALTHFYRAALNRNAKDRNAQKLTEAEDLIATAKNLLRGQGFLIVSEGTGDVWDERVPWHNL
jgi:hypothetical protein